MEKLLIRINDIIKKYSNINEITGQNFNLFKVCEIQDKELIICRFIYQLINPKGLHCQGNVFLKKFIVHVLGGQILDSELNINDNSNLIISNEELSEAIVHKEYPISYGRRIDLVIETKKRKIPIEVKIDAGDQKNQCRDYAEWSKKQNKLKEYLLYYLTLDGHFPSSNSLDYDKIDVGNYDNDDDLYSELENKYHLKCISFKDEIITWLEECIKDISIINKRLIIDNIIQFISVIREMCNMGTEIVNNEVEDILYNRENFKSYIAMKNSEKNITSKVLKQIIKRLNEWALPKGFSIDDIYNNYDKEIDELCEGKKIGDKFPGFGIICQNTRFNCTLRICFEANARGSLYYGIYIVNDEDRTAEIFNRIRISISDLGGKSQSNYWPYFKYLTVQDQEIDFVKPNDAFAELLNEETLNRCIEFIEEQLLNLVKIVEME